MQALNIQAEFRKHLLDPASKVPSNKAARLQMDAPAFNAAAETHANNQAATGQWVEDDGDYYTREEWDLRQSEDAASCSYCWGIVPDPGISYVPEDGALCECGVKA
jgi:hypothetical protein